MAIDDDVIVAGAKGVDDAAPDAGAVYVFRWNGVTWGQEAKLTGSPADDGDRLGLRSVSVSGDAIIAGAPHIFPNAELGKAFIFRRSEGTWKQEQYFSRPDIQFNQLFANQVAISGNVAVLSIPTIFWVEEKSGPPGSVYVFANDGSAWIEEERLQSPESYCGPDVFGVSIALRNGLLAVGAAGGSEGLPPCCAGTAYLYQRVGATWIERGKLSRSDPALGDVFGNALAMSQAHVVVGAEWDDDACPTNRNCDSGSAYVFPIAECRDDGGSFDVSGSDCTDSDGDAVAGICADNCRPSDLGDTIVIGSCESGVGNQLFDNGCTMADRIAECVAGGAGNHGLIVKCITRVAGDWHRGGVISGVEYARIVRCARFVHRKPGRSRIPTQRD